MNFRSVFRLVRCLPYSVWFNFRQLPFHQAIHLPILIYKPRVLSASGAFRITGKISTGMIRLGWPMVSIYSNSGIMIENRGTVIFNGKCKIGNDSALSVGPTGTLELGNNVVGTCALRIACYSKISIGDNTLIGWNCMFCDTDFHKICYDSLAEGTRMSQGYGPITIGRQCWIANGCKIYKNVVIPDEVTVGSDIILKKSPECTGPCAIISRSVVDIRKGVRWNPENDKIIYPQREATSFS